MLILYLPLYLYFIVVYDFLAVEKAFLIPILEMYMYYLSIRFPTYPVTQFKYIAQMLYEYIHLQYYRKKSPFQKSMQD